MDRTVVLVREAKNGDRGALAELIERYYDVWLRQYHGRLGAVVRRGGYDTVDLVQSAVSSAIEGLPKLQNEGVFFTWVTSIIRHKLAKRRVRLAREQRLEGSVSSIPQPDNGSGRRPEESVERLEEYERTLTVIGELFPEFPGEMAAVQMNLLDGLPVQEIVRRLGRSKRTVYRWLHDGTLRLQRCLK